jgi:hypothetical protein
VIAQLRSVDSLSENRLALLIPCRAYQRNTPVALFRQGGKSKKIVSADSLELGGEMGRRGSVFTVFTMKIRRTQVSERVSQQQTWFEGDILAVIRGKPQYGKQNQGFISRMDGNVQVDIMETRPLFSPSVPSAVGPGQQKNPGG